MAIQNDWRDGIQPTEVQRNFEGKKTTIRESLLDAMIRCTDVPEI